MSPARWEALIPGRLQYEQAALEAAGIRYTVDEQAERAGVVQLRVSAIGEQPTSLTVTFPDLYPFVRPSVRLTAGARQRMSHHVHPFSGDLCLLGRATAEWRPEYTLAWLLTTQLPKTLQAGEASPKNAAEIAALTDLEQRQAEPWTDYYSCFADGSMILVDSAWRLPKASRGGVLDVRLSRFEPGTASTPGVGFLQGAVFTLRDHEARQLGTLSGQLPSRFPEPVTGRWGRLPGPIAADTPEDILAAVKRTTPHLLDTPWQAHRRTGWELQTLGLTFPEERVHRGTGDGWIFLVRVRPSGRPQTPPPKKGQRQRGVPPPTPTRTSVHLIRAGYAGRSDIAERVPELAGLHARHVAVFGVGALGSTVVEHLARAGVGQLTLIDRDHLEPGNLVRHAASFGMVGWSKAAAAGQIAFNAGAEITPMVVQASIGSPRMERYPEETDQVDDLAQLIDGADLVVDCTAEKGLQQALAWLARRHDTTYLAASATNGGWGGRVVRLTSIPGTACWACLEYALDDESVPAAPAAPEETGIQPVGCADPTFTGSGFDLAEVALHTVRMAVATLQADRLGGYPDNGQDVYILSLRDPGGLPLAPAWAGYALPVHPSCLAQH